MATFYELDEVAADQRDMVAAFRANGSKSFQDAPDALTARSNYEASCQVNGLQPDAIAHVEDVEVAAVDAAGATSGQHFKVRVYEPRQTLQTAAPTLVFFHGGGWVIGSLETHDAVCRRLATLTGLPVVAVDYRLGPENMFPAGHLDCKQAIAWIRDNAASRALDPHRLVTVGDSAGGGLATVCAFDPAMRVDGTTVVAQVPLYPMLDITDSNQNWERVSEGFALTSGTLEWFVENYVQPADLADSRVSPLLLARKAAAGEAAAELLKQPPALILSLGLDPLAAEAIEYAGLLANGGTMVELVHLPQHAHGLFTSAAKVRTGETFLERVAQFVAQHV